MIFMKKKFIQNNNNNCICYYRYSSHAQNEQSIDQQRELAVRYAETHDLNIVKEYIDEALSGTTDDRPNYRLMLKEIEKIKPHALIVYKIDRLSRDRYELLDARRKIRDAGCQIIRVAEVNLDPDDPASIMFEALYDGMAEFYSANLRQNVMRGMRYNAENALYNGHKLLGYTVDDTKHYVIDNNTASIVLRIYNHYADGKELKVIADELNAQGLKTSLGRQFNINGLRHILKNRAYIGEYRYNDIVIPDGMPRIVSDELFASVQRRFELNRHKSKPVMSKSKYEANTRFWLTGKLFCGECKESLHGISGTSKQGTIHYYYACKNYRKHKCKLRSIRKDLLETCVIEILREFLSDTEKLASLAVDVSDYCKKMYSDDSYLKSLEHELKQTENELKNVVNAIKSGCFNTIIQDTLNELESRQKSLQEAIETEKVKLSLAYDDYSIKHYFEMYADADFDDDETRDRIFEYFIDKIYVFEDKLIIDMFYSDDHTEIDLDAFIANYEGAEKVFDKNAISSTRCGRNELPSNRTNSCV